MFFLCVLFRLKKIGKFSFFSFFFGGFFYFFLKPKLFLEYLDLRLYSLCQVDLDLLCLVILDTNKHTDEPLIRK